LDAPAEAHVAIEILRRCNDHKSLDDFPQLAGILDMPTKARLGSRLMARIAVLSQRKYHPLEILPSLHGILLSTRNRRQRPTGIETQ
jgi:hypothetical protein